MTEQQAVSATNSATIETHTGQINSLSLGLTGLTATTIPTITEKYSNIINNKAGQNNSNISLKSKFYKL